MRKFILLIVLAITCSNLFSQKSEIEFKLFNLPDIVFKPIEVPKGYVAAYELRIKQPIDHEHPDKGFFYQKVFLSHKGFNKPTVMITEGYDQPRNRISELSQVLDANQLTIEHRFFGESIPEDLDYGCLNLTQATSDLHHINTLLKQVYSGKWISSGISKGGQTTIYYRYFYPEDVDVSIPYVAPFNLSLEDERIYNFLDTIGSDVCRDKIKNVQLKILQNREEAIKYLRWYSFGAALTYTYLTIEEAFEYAVLEYPFSFWQWGSACSDIPDTTASLEHLLVYLLNISNIDFFSDSYMEKYGSHYYQAATETGYYGYQTEQFKTMLKAVPVESNPLAIFVPNKMKVEYNESLAKEVYNWVQTSGDKFVYIYGGNDTWSATAIPENIERDALWFMLKGKDHAQARIINFTESEMNKFVQTLETWLEIPVSPNLLMALPQ